MAHEQHALVGYVHPYDTFPDPAKDATLTHELPVDAALGKVDYIEVLGFSDHKSTAAVWYRLLNCGFRLPAAAGTDAMANFASLRGPVGLNRVYAQVPNGPLNIESWLSSLKDGHTFATNGPLLGFTLGGQPVGGELHLPPGESKVKFAGWLRSIVPIDHLEMICNGRVLRELTLNDDRESADIEDAIPLSQSGWCLLRAWSEKAEHPVLDAYPYATTSAIYVTVAGSASKPAADAAYFIAWIDRMIQDAKSNRDWNTDAEKTSVLNMLEQARMVYVGLQK
jgi:TolB protein